MEDVLWADPNKEKQLQSVFRASLLHTAVLHQGSSTHRSDWIPVSQSGPVAAFHDIQQSLSKKPMLYSPNFDEHFILQTDASDWGLDVQVTAIQWPTSVRNCSSGRFGIQPWKRRHWPSSGPPIRSGTTSWVENSPWIQITKRFSGWKG